MRLGLPKWDGYSAPPRLHVIGHRLLGPPVAAVWALVGVLGDACGEYRDRYRTLRSWHADRWDERDG